MKSQDSSNNLNQNPRLREISANLLFVVARLKDYNKNIPDSGLSCAEQMRRTQREDGVEKPGNFMTVLTYFSHISC